MRCLLTLLLSLLSGTAPSLLAQGEGTGTVTGVVYDATSGRPVPQVKVTVIAEPKKTSVTNLDGVFKLELSPGAYSLRLTQEKYMNADVTDVMVSAGEVVDASTVIAASSEVTSVDVVESISAQTANAASLIAERKLAQTVSDTISAEEIKNSTASNAAAALQQVTGVTVVGEGFVHVRGLSERYSATQLNNAMVATTEPEKKVVPLDLFPAGLIDSIQVKKSYTPDLPGEFSAGLVQIKTIEFPHQATFQVSYEMGFNTQTTSREFLTYPGGGTDFWGFDDGTRAFPDYLPRGTRVDRFNFSPKQLQEFGRGLPVNWEPTPDESARPSLNFGVIAGNTYGKLGIVGAFQFSSGLQSIPNQTRNFYRPGLTSGTVRLVNSYNYDASNTNARMGGILNLSYQLKPDHKLFLRNFLSRDTDNNTRMFEGYHDEFATNIRNTRLRWVERSLISSQWGGEHLLENVANSILTWQIGYSRARRDEPDLRENVYGWSELKQAWAYFDDSQSSFRMYNDSDETIWNPQINWLTPFYKSGLSGSVKFGFDYTESDRDFLSRRLRLRLAGNTGIDRTLPPNQLLAEENIRPNGFELAETTRITDAYTGLRKVYGGYGMLDLSFSPKWRVIGGLRFEKVNQNVTTFDWFNPDRARIESPFNKTNALPGINVVHYLTAKMNLRFGFSRTVSRPDFRELALFDFRDITGGQTLVGNPELVQSSIDNFDARWEYFPGGGQLLAASFFYKRIQDPIERSILASSNLLSTFVNAEDARNYGVELEFRRNLGFVTNRLSEFAVSTNYTYVNSQIDLTNVENTVLTSKLRPMQGQSAHVFNFIGEWARPKWRSTARLYSNYFSDRITDVGGFGLPDVIQKGYTSVDFVYEFSLDERGKWKLRFSAEDLNNPRYRWTQGGEIFQQWYTGRSFKIGTSYQVF